MDRNKFGWEREENRFREKRSRIAEALLGTKVGLLLMAISVGLLFVIFLITPVLLFRGALDYLIVPILLLVYVGIALLGARILEVKRISGTEESRRDHSEDDTG